MRNGNIISIAAQLGWTASAQYKEGRLFFDFQRKTLSGVPFTFTAEMKDGKGKEAICRAIFALGGVRWFILEGEKEGNDTILFGIVIGLMEDEYGYISLNELSDIELDLTKQGFGKLQVRQQENFHPVPLKKLRDSRLQEFLARMGE